MSTADDEAKALAELRAISEGEGKEIIRAIAIIVAAFIFWWIIVVIFVGGGWV